MASPQQKMLDVPLTRGLRQDQETVLMLNGGLSDCTDVTFDKSARLKRRGGFRALGTSTYTKFGSFAGPVQRVGTGANGELVAFCDGDSFLYFPSEDRVASIGQSITGSNFNSCIRGQVLSKFAVGQNQAAAILWSDCASVTGHGGQTWIAVIYMQLISSTYTILLDLIDAVTYSRAYSGLSIGTISGAQNAAPRVLGIGSSLFVLFADQSSNILCAKIDLSGTTPSITAAANIITDGDSTNTFFDTSPSQGGFVVAYRSNNAGNRRCMVRTFNTSLALLNTFNGATGWRNSATGTFWSTPCISVVGSSSTTDRIYAIAYDPATTSVEFASFPYDLSAIQQARNSSVSACTMVTIGRAANGSTGYALGMWCENSSASQVSDPRGHIWPVVLHDTGTLSRSFLDPYLYYTIGSRIFRNSSGNELFAFARFNDPSPSAPLPNAQNHLLLVDWGVGASAGDPVPIAHVANGLTPLDNESVSSPIGGACDLGNGRFLLTSILNLGSTITSGQQVGCYVCQATGPQRYLNLVAHGTMHVAGATPLSYDGQRLVELGFYNYPAVAATCATTSTTGGSMLAGVYQYRFTFEWTDAGGQLHISDASPAFSVDISSSATTTNKVSFAIPSLMATRKQRILDSTGGGDIRSPVRVTCYRTTAGGTTFHRTGAFAANDTFGGVVVHVTVDDTYADSSLIQGTDTSSTVNTTANKTLRIRSSAQRSFVAITVTSGASTSKAQIVIDLNAGFVSGRLPFTASVIGSNQIQILGTGQYLEVDSVANGSNLNTAVGFPAAGQAVVGNVGSGEILYVDSTGDNELPNQAPPPCLMMTEHGGRLWGIDAEFPERVWATKTFADGIAPSYSSALQVLVPGAGRINGLAAQDDKIFALAANGTYLASYGDGPDNTGTTGIFPSPVLLSTSANCDDPRGVIVGDDGIYFTGQDQATTTIYFMPRGASSPKAIGNRVRAALATTPVCRGAVYRQENARMEFLFVDSDTSPSINKLVYYHYRLPDEDGVGQFTYAIPQVGGGAYSIGDWSLTGTSRHATVIGYSSGYAIQDDAQSTDPTGGSVLYSFTTGDIRPNGVLAWGESASLTLLGTAQAADSFTVSLSYDSGQSFETTTFSTTETSGPMLRRWESPTRKLQYGSVMLRITQTSAGAGNIWHGLTLEPIPLGGTVLLPAGKKQ